MSTWETVFHEFTEACNALGCDVVESNVPCTWNVVYKKNGAFLSVIEQGDILAHELTYITGWCDGYETRGHS